MSSLDAPLRTSVVVIARDPLVRSGIASVLAGYPELVVTEALESAGSELAADVVIWDLPVAEPPLKPPTAAMVPPVLALVNFESDARGALRAGARGALLRSAPAAGIAAAARAVAAGHWVLAESVGRSLLELSTPAEKPRLALLSPREDEVLELLSEGLSNRGIAERLGISRHTAKFHVNAILEKLGAESRTEAVVLAVRSGLLTL